MTNTLPYKTKQFFFVLIKLSIVVGAFYFIYQKLANNTDLNFIVFVDFLSKNNPFSLKNTFFLLILTFFNWFFEILKWQTLVGPIKKINFKSALEQSLGALTASLLTPNRIGDYGAKTLYYIAGYRKRIVLMNLLGNMMQMTVTTVLGSIGLYFFIAHYNVDINYHKLARFLLIGLMLLLVIGFGIHKSTFRIKGLSLNNIKHAIRDYPNKNFFLAFLLSCLRYAIFSFQFYFLLLIFGVDTPYLSAMAVITSMYLLASVIPSIFIFDVLIKGSVAIYLFSIFGVDSLTILSVVMLMWLLNFVLPSIFGSFYVLQFNFPKNND